MYADSDTSTDSDELHDCGSYTNKTHWEMLLPLIPKHQIAKLRLNSLPAAIYADDVEMIVELLEGNKDKVNEGDDRGNSCLHIAAEYGSLNALEYFLSFDNVNINAKNYSGNTPLIQALYRSDSNDIVTCLLNHDCDVNISSGKGLSPLHFVAIRKDTELGRLMIEKGANVDAKDNDGFTPLHEAVKSKAVEFVCMLLYYNASVNEPTNFTKCTPFHIAINNGSKELIEILINYVDDFNYRDRFGQTYLSIAILKVSPIAFEILDRGVESVPSPYGMLTSILCSFIRTEDSLKWIWTLLSKGASVDLRDIEYLYSVKGFCEEIEAIFLSEVPITFNIHVKKFIQQLVFNNCIMKREFKNYSVPSLKEIARDAVRTVIFHKYQRGANFKAYNVIMAMNIPKQLKDFIIDKSIMKKNACYLVYTYERMLASCGSEPVRTNDI